MDSLVLRCESKELTTDRLQRIDVLEDCPFFNLLLIFCCCIDYESKLVFLIKKRDDGIRAVSITAVCMSTRTYWDQSPKYTANESRIHTNSCVLELIDIITDCNTADSYFLVP